MKAKQVILLSSIVLTYLSSCKSDVKNNSTENSTFTIENLTSTTSPWVDDTVGMKNLVEEILSGVKNGEIKAYYSSEDSIPITKEKLNEIFNPLPDTLMVENIDKPGTFDAKIIENEKLISSPFQVFWFNENWSFDKTSVTLEKKVKELGIAKTVYSEDGKLKGTKIFFVVKLK